MFLGAPILPTMPSSRARPDAARVVALAWPYVLVGLDCVLTYLLLGPP
ncbi:MAG: hypothetical protein ABW352_18280 [Polyangiales bacterium]